MIFYGSSTEIPDDLLLAHEEGKVVFFCGAGISYDADIPLFKELVSKTARKAKIKLGKEEKKLLHKGDCDVVYQEMERRVGPEKRIWLRSFTSKLLTPRKSLTDIDLSYHYALLRLSVVRDTQKLHLVTTNYDSLFDIAYQRLCTDGKFTKTVSSYAAPLLPVPKKRKWDGLIYLHGKLQHEESDDNLNSLIISSGDFGVAYLTERWAARFVSELFREYTICFVGYSANDTIMRYMVDALAADKLQGETPRMVYAFDGYVGEDKDSMVNQWEKKGITVIPFKKSSKTDFSELKRTLNAWSDFYSAGVSGPVRIILDEGSKVPNTVGPDGKSSIKRVLWALRRTDILPIITFAKLEPPPPLEWFDVFLEEQDKQRELNKETDLAANMPQCMLPFSCVDKPDKYLDNLLRWLSRHLDNFRLLALFCRINKPLSPYVIDYLEREILNADDKTAAGRMPNTLRKLWLLWLESQRTTRMYIGDTIVYPWISDFNQMDKSLGVELAFADFIRPHLHLTARDFVVEDKKDLRAIFAWEYRINATDMDVQTLKSYEFRFADVPCAAYSAIESSMLQLCKMRREMGDEQDEYDDSEYFIQDISGPIDDDNAWGGSSWRIIVILMRFVWDRLLKENHRVATRIAKNWFDSPHPLFKRLALYAVTKDNNLDPNRTVKWLLARPQERLFGNTYCREVLNLLTLCGKRMSQQSLGALDEALSVQADGEVQLRYDNRRALYLDRLENASVALTSNMKDFLCRYRSAHPDWNRRNRKFDGLSFWISDGADEEGGSSVPISLSKIPETNSDIRAWLFEYEKHRNNDSRHDQWKIFCQESFDRACNILINEGVFGSTHDKAWGGLLIEACKEENALKLWQSLPKDKIFGFVRDGDIVGSNFSSLAEWFRLLSGYGVEIDLYLKVAQGLMSHKEAFGRGIEYEVIMEGVLRRWYATKPKDDSKIQSPFAVFFESIMSGDTDALRSARRELLTQLSNLTIVDKAWVFKSIVPRLSWDRSDAAEIWRSAIKMTWLNWDLLREIKDDFVRAASHFNELDSSGEWYANVFVTMATSKNSGYGSATYREIIRLLPREGRLAVARRIRDMLHNAGEKIDIYWKEEIGPFVKNIWPPEDDYSDSEIAGHLFSGIAYCKDVFADAAHVLLDKHRGTVVLDDVAFRLANPPKGTESRCKLYPDDVLNILSRVDRTRNNYGVAMWVGKCLDVIGALPRKNNKDTFAKDERYVLLKVYVDINRGS